MSEWWWYTVTPKWNRPTHYTHLLIHSNKIKKTNKNFFLLEPKCTREQKYKRQKKCAGKKTHHNLGISFIFIYLLFWVLFYILFSFKMWVWWWMCLCCMLVGFLTLFLFCFWDVLSVFMHNWYFARYVLPVC